jgi:hypothetical protein
MLTIELIQHDLKQNKACIQFSPSAVQYLTQSTTGNHKVWCLSTVCRHTFIPTFVRSGQLAVIERVGKTVNRKAHTHTHTHTHTHIIVISFHHTDGEHTRIQLLNRSLLLTKLKLQNGL